MIEQRKPNIDYFRVFGCKCYVLNDREDLGKFDPKSDESIFIGYSLNSKTYRVFNKRTRTILESSNVYFFETKTYSNACPSNPNAILPDLPTVPPSTAFASNSFASDFIDPTDYDLTTLTGPIIVPAHPGSSTTSVSSDAFMIEPSTSTSIDSVTPESMVSPLENFSTEPPTVASPEPVREQTTSPILVPIPEETPLPSPSSSQRTYAQVVRDTRLEVVLNIEPLTNLQEGSSSGNQPGVLAVYEENDASNNHDFEPLEVQQALSDPYWVRAMQEELAEFERNKAEQKKHFRSMSVLGDKLVSWSSLKQNCVSLSTVEAEYVAAACCCSQVLWMKTQLADFGYTMQRIPIYCDSRSAIQITVNPVQHSRTKQIDIRYYFIKDHVKKGNIELYFVESDLQLADLFTKPFDEKRHFFLLSKLGMLDLPPEV
ncbi:hypothetical protein OSB04_024249 [Centaurea solstitialis]|uniref:Retroviral polymerase SH3-like domain-containing protein n=1 Tax=Centaurea solstitialis TaxID=347529 RepID=A0AA38T479_9ASTR|nr:hypothetical protein OSB04_024249 [Centaurea solstitialis]